MTERKTKPFQGISIRNGILREETETFLNKREELLKENEGRHVLIKGSEIVAIRDTEEEVKGLGYELYQDEKFLIKEIQSKEKEPVRRVFAAS